MKYYALSSDQAARIEFDSLAQRAGEDAAAILSLEDLQALGIEGINKLAESHCPEFTYLDDDWDIYKELKISAHKKLYVSGEIVVDDKGEACDSWKLSWLKGFWSKIEEKIIEVIESLDELEKKLVMVCDTDHPLGEPCYMAVVRLDDYTYAFRHECQSIDQDWELGDAEKAAGYYVRWKKELDLPEQQA